MDVCDHNLDEGEDEASTTISLYMRFEVEHTSHHITNPTV